MKAVVAVVVGVAIAGAAFTLYRWLEEDEERARAESAVNEYCFMVVPCGERGGDGDAAQPLPSTVEARANCVTSGLTALPDSGEWSFRITCGRGSHCEAIDLEEFRVYRRHSIYVGTNAEGIRIIPCSADEWTGRQAARRLEQSPWARERKARFFSCVPATAVALAYRSWASGRGNQGQPPFSRWEGWAVASSPYSNRFRCSYIAPRDGYVVIRTTGADTFEIERSPS